MADSTTGTVVVLAGGLSHERDVSLRSGRRVARALADAGYRVVESDLTQSLIGTLQGLPDAVAFPVLHGGPGEDGAVREVLDLVGVPYVGSPGPSCRIAFDKAVATPLIQRAGLPTPTQAALPQDVFRELGAHALVAAVGRQLGFPVMVKPARSGSARAADRFQTVVGWPASRKARARALPIAPRPSTATEERRSTVMPPQ